MSSTASAATKAAEPAGSPRSVAMARDAVKAAKRHLKQVKLQLEGARAAVKAAKRARKKAEKEARDAKLRSQRAAATRRTVLAAKPKAPARAASAKPQPKPKPKPKPSAKQVAASRNSRPAVARRPKLPASRINTPEPLPPIQATLLDASDARGSTAPAEGPA